MIDLWPVGDVFRSVRIVKSGQSLIEVTLSRGDCGNDGRLGATSEGVLQDSCQLTFPIEKELEIQKFMEVSGSDQPNSEEW